MSERIEQCKGKSTMDNLVDPTRSTAVLSLLPLPEENDVGDSSVDSGDAAGEHGQLVVNEVESTKSANAHLTFENKWLKTELCKTQIELDEARATIRRLQNPEKERRENGNVENEMKESGEVAKRTSEETTENFFDSMKKYLRDSATKFQVMGDDILDLTCGMLRMVYIIKDCKKLARDNGLFENLKQILTERGLLKNIGTLYERHGALAQDVLDDATRELSEFLLIGTEEISPSQEMLQSAANDKDLELCGKHLSRGVGECSRKRQCNAEDIGEPLIKRTSNVVSQSQQMGQSAENDKDQSSGVRQPSGSRSIAKEEEDC